MKRHGLLNLVICLGLLLNLSPRGHVPVQASPPAQQPSTRNVDIVFVMDTSESMDDEFSALCENIRKLVADLQAQNIAVRYEILGVQQNRQCTKSTVPQTVSNSTVSQYEDWGPATRDLAAGYAWKPSATRLIIPMTDEGPEDGNPCQAPGPDEDAINKAIAAATANRVRVAPILGKGYDSCVENLAKRLASGTGGYLFYSTTPANDLAKGIRDLIGAVVADKDGDGIPDDQDPAPTDPCKPDPQAVCLPKQVCGQTNTPHWDDDKDGRTDEELPNGKDDDGDGLIDEDVGGMNCPYPQQDCGVNSHRGFDDDKDGKIDEEVDDGRDNDGDNYIDEDVSCPCPAPQIVSVNDTPGIDDDHDFHVDEEQPNGKDDDGDGCIDEDIGSLSVLLSVASVPQVPAVGTPIAFNLTLVDQNHAPLTNQSLKLMITKPDKQVISLSGTTDKSGKWIIPENFTITEPGAFLYGFSLEGMGKLEYPVTVPGNPKTVNYEEMFRSAAIKGGLPPDGIDVYVLPITSLNNSGQTLAGDIAFGPSVGSSLLQPQGPLTLSEEDQLRMYAFRYLYPGDYTYVPPDPEKLKRARALLEEDAKRESAKCWQYLDDGLTLYIFAKEAFLCGTFVIGTAGTVGWVACAPLVVHLTSTAVEKLVEREYKAGRMDQSTYNLWHGGTRVVGSSIRYIVAPEGTGAQEAVRALKVASDIVAGSSEMVYASDADGTILARNAGTTFKIVEAGQDVSILGSTLMVTARSPIQVEVIDPLRRRLAYDASQNTILSEIPGASITLPGMEPQRLWIPNPVSGKYQIRIAGTGAGSYTLEVASANKGERPEIDKHTGSVTSGDDLTYQAELQVDHQNHIQTAKTTLVARNGKNVTTAFQGGTGIAVALVVGLLAASGVFVYVTGQKRKQKPAISSRLAQAKLIVASGYEVGQSTPIKKGDFLVGRSSTCDLRFAEPSTSRQHARIRYAQGQWFLQDLGSSTGTYVNGQQVQATKLSDGDIIRIGETEMQFRITQQG